MPGTPPTRHRTVAAAILAIGWAIALGVYLTATPVVVDPEVEEIEHSKGYLRQTEMLGGKAAVLGNDLREWFDSLWHGQRLAYTLAVLTVIVAAGYYAWEATAPPAEGDG